MMNHAPDSLPAQKWPPITVAQAQAISALTDPALRNLKITQAYHDLKIALACLFGIKNVTWCAYATWASKTAGTFIRAEEVPAFVHDWFTGIHQLQAGIDQVNEALERLLPGTRLDRSIFTCTIEEAIGDVTKYVGQGNLLVFQELAPLYAAWLHKWKQLPSAFDQREIDAFIAEHFRAGPVDQGGQDLLIEAFRAYYDAMLEKDDVRKAQLIFLANALVGYHEQTRLGGPILGALNAPLSDIFLRNARTSALGKLRLLLHAAIDPIIDKLLRPLAKPIQTVWHQLCTRLLMTLTIPDATLNIGKDVPALSPDQMFPVDLKTATYEPLVKILAKLDRTPDTVAGSAAKDWGELADRMNFVVDFFRTRQQDQALYAQPFTDQQTAVIREGGIPSGKL